MSTLTAKINFIIGRHFKHFFPAQYLNPDASEWSVLRRSMKKILSEEIKEAHYQALVSCGVLKKIGEIECRKLAEQYYQSLHKKQKS